MLRIFEYIRFPIFIYSYSNIKYSAKNIRIFEYSLRSVWPIRAVDIADNNSRHGWLLELGPCKIHIALWKWRYLNVYQIFTVITVSNFLRRYWHCCLIKVFGYILARLHNIDSFNPMIMSAPGKHADRITSLRGWDASSNCYLPLLQCLPSINSKVN